MNWSFDPIPPELEVILRGWLFSMVHDSSGIEQGTIATLANGASDTVDHSETDNDQIIVQVYNSSGVKLKDTEVTITLTDSETVTITNISGAALTGLTVNMCFR